MSYMFTMVYTCPMHAEVQKSEPSTCPKCGMTLVPVKTDMSHKKDLQKEHGTHTMSPVSSTSFWQKLNMSMTMTMGMNHTGLAGREMAKLMEIDVRNKFFLSFFLTIPILAYSMGRMMLGWNLPSPIPIPWLLFLLTTPVFFYGGWLFLYSSYVELKTWRLGITLRPEFSALFFLKELRKILLRFLHKILMRDPVCSGL